MRRKLFVRLAFSVFIAMALQAVAALAIVHRFFEANAVVDRALIAYSVLAALALTVVLTFICENVLSRMLRREQERMRELALKNAVIDAKEAELTRAEQLALVGRMSAGLAHEIGNPLAAVVGYLSLLRDDQPDNDLLQRIERELNRINGLIHELLDYARPAPLKKDWHPLTPLLDNALSLLSHQPRGARITASVTVPAVRVHVDRERFTQILLNIFLNAADAMQGQGVLTLTGELLGDRLRLAIADQGPGFSVEALRHAGEPFYSSKGVGKGTGLGLAVSKRLMQDQGGELEIKNVDGAVITLLVRATI